MGGWVGKQAINFSSFKCQYPENDRTYVKVTIND